MKLYTEEQLLDICQSVAEKFVADSLSTESVKEKVNYYGYSKIEIDIETIEDKLNNDNVDVIKVQAI